MTYGEDRLLRFVKIANEPLDPLVGANIFRSAAAGAVDGVILFRIYLREALIDHKIMPELLGVGLVSLEVMQRCFENIAFFLIGADHMHNVTNRLHSLLKNKD